MEKKEATYQYLEEAHGNGMFFFTSCCGNRMYSTEHIVKAEREGTDADSN